MARSSSRAGRIWRCTWKSTVTTGCARNMRRPPMADKDLVLDSKDRYKEDYGFSEPENYTFKAKKGLNREVVLDMSRMKGEPQWMTDLRLKALDIFYKKPMPTWGADLSTIDFDNIYYYIKPAEDHASSWDDVSPEVGRNFDKLGIPEAERKLL